MAHYSGNSLSLSFHLFWCVHFPSYLSLSRGQVAQLTHVLDERLKELDEDAEREKAFKDIVATIAKEKGKAVEAAEKRAQSTEKAQLVVEKKLTEVEVKLQSAQSLNWQRQKAWTWPKLMRLLT